VHLTGDLATSLGWAAWCQGRFSVSAQKKRRPLGLRSPPDIQRGKSPLSIVPRRFLHCFSATLFAARARFIPGGSPLFDKGQLQKGDLLCLFVNGQQEHDGILVKCAYTFRLNRDAYLDWLAGHQGATTMIQAPIPKPITRIVPLANIPHIVKMPLEISDEKRRFNFVEMGKPIWRIGTRVSLTSTHNNEDWNKLHR
jgi:hypothetical protein